MKKLILLFVATLMLFGCYKKDNFPPLEEKVTLHFIRVEINYSDEDLNIEYTTNTVSKGKPDIVKDEYKHDEDESNLIIYNIKKFPSTQEFYFKATALNGINTLKVKLYIDNKLVEEKEHDNSWNEEIKVSHSFK